MTLGSTFFKTNPAMTLNHYAMTASLNPARDRVHLTFDLIRSGDVHIEVANTEGKRIIERDYWLKSEGASFEVDVSQLPKGLYVVIAKHQGQQEFSRLMID